MRQGLHGHPAERGFGDGHHEGIPVALMEAMSYGIPVISTPAGGVPELLSGGAGLLVPPGNPSPLADAIESMLRDPQLREQYGRAGRARVDNEFNIKSISIKLNEKFLRFSLMRTIQGMIEKVCRKHIDIISYHSGDYNSAILKQCREQNINLGFPVVPSLEIDERREVPRLGVYHSSTDVLRFRIKWEQTLRSMGLHTSYYIY